MKQTDEANSLVSMHCSSGNLMMNQSPREPFMTFVDHGSVQEGPRCIECDCEFERNQEPNSP